MQGGDESRAGATEVTEDSPTITDSPAATRRQRRKSGTPVVSLPSDPQLARSPAVLTPATSSDANRAMQRDQATRQHASRVALFGEDVALMRTFSVLVGVLCVALVATLPFLRGNPILRSVLWGGALFSIFTSLWVYVVLRDVARYDQKLINITALLSVLIAYSGVLYLGVHSPGALVILPGLFFVARSQSGAAAIAMYIVCAGMQALMATLILTGTIRDPGLITAEDSEFRVRVITQVLVQLLYIGTYLLARTSRHGTFQAMNKVIAAENKAQQREAAFVEVRADLNRVLGAVGAGHYTDQLLGSYTLGGIIGRGAMGEVYEAMHVDSAEIAAAKVLHPHVLAKPSSVERFLREAEAASTLQSPHSVRILDASLPGAPVPYLIMERLFGHDLAHHLRELRRLPMADLVILVQQVGSVIDLAAAKGIVHRDLKPQNLFLAEGSGAPCWKVLDFGASKLAEHSGTLTQGRVIGTPAYMSPQQAKGEDVDGAADRYCLAAIVYRSLTGRPPFTGKDLPTTLYHVVYGSPAQPSVLADVDPAFDLLLAVGMAKDQRDRFATGREFAEAIEAAAQGRVSDPLKARAEALLARTPWGMSPN